MGDKLLKIGECLSQVRSSESASQAYSNLTIICRKQSICFQMILTISRKKLVVLYKGLRSLFETLEFVDVIWKQKALNTRSICHKKVSIQKIWQTVRGPWGIRHNPNQFYFLKTSFIFDQPFDIWSRLQVNYKTWNNLHTVTPDQPRLTFLTPASSHILI